MRQSLLNQVFIVSALLAFSWLWLQWTHEAGHVIAGLATGAEVLRIVLHPATFSRTDFSTNPSPGITVWGGPILGCVLGAGLPLILAAVHKPAQVVPLAVAGLVLVGNGAYTGLGTVLPVGDAEVMLETGTPPWAMLLFGGAAAVTGRMLLVNAWRSAARTEPPAFTVSLIVPTLAGMLAGVGLILSHSKRGPEHVQSQHTHAEPYTQQVARHARPKSTHRQQTANQTRR